MDVTGKRFVKLIAIRQMKKKRYGKVFWLCQCDCGRNGFYNLNHLMTGHTRSCGCLKKDNVIIGKLTTTHGASSSRLYSIWNGMRTRCSYIKSNRYYIYGEKGIRVCDEWSKDFVSFQKWAKNNGYKEHLQIDRIDNNKGYYPKNCRWVTPSENSNNRKTCVIFKIGNESMTAAQISRKYNVSYKRILYLRNAKNITNIDIDWINKNTGSGEGLKCLRKIL